MYKVLINRNAGEGDGGGSSYLSNETTEAFKNRFGDSLIDPNEEQKDEGGKGDNGGAGDNKGEINEGESSNGSKKDDDKGAGGEGSGDNDSAGNNSSSTPLSYLVSKYGVDLENDEDYKDLDLTDDSIEAIEKFYGKREEKVKLSAVQEFMEEVPEVKDLVEHLTKGGSIKTWKQQQEAKELSIEFDKDDIDGKANFMLEVYKAKGIPEKRAKLLVEALKDDNELDSELETEVTAIKADRKQKADLDAKREIEQAEAARKANEEVVTKISGIVKQGKLVNDYVIPESDRKTFNEFIFSEELPKRYETLNYEQRLMIDYIIFKDFKIKALETKIVDNSGVNKTKVRIGSSGDGGSGAGSKDNSISLAELKRMSQGK